MRETTPLTIKNDYERQGSKIISFIQKLRESQGRALEAKARLWGFDFEQSAPALSRDSLSTAQEEQGMTNQISWRPISASKSSENVVERAILPRKLFCW
jgi:hypothetical protein